MFRTLNPPPPIDRPPMAVPRDGTPLDNLLCVYCYIPARAAISKRHAIIYCAQCSRVLFRYYARPGQPSVPPFTTNVDDEDDSE